MVRALGIDPGLRNFGISVLDYDGVTRPVARAARVFETRPNHDEGRITDDDLARVNDLCRRLSEAIDLTKPDCMAAETYRVYTTKAAKDGWKVAYIYGMIVAVAYGKGIPFYAVTPGDVKRRIGGSSSASKEAVMRNAIATVDQLDGLLLNLNKSVRDHASDAAGIALLALQLHIKAQAKETIT